MAQQIQLEKAKYRQWAKAGLGLGYLKEGLAPFCHDIAKQQHKDILDNIQKTKSLPLPVMCATCQLRTLKPDHFKAGKRLCPYGQAYCNCWFPNGKIACLNNICGAIYDGIIQSHASTPPSPNWRYTDSQLWTVDPWSMAKCYICAPGYDQKTSAADTDCTGLLHVIINNKYFHNHIACNLTGASIFSIVRDHRSKIFHSSHQELEEATANSYIDDMITVLQDGQELVNQPDAQKAVQKLQDLKSKDLVITSENHEQLLKQIREYLMYELGDLKSTVSTKEELGELDKKISNIEDLLKQTKYEVVKSTVSNKEECGGLKQKLSTVEIQMSEQKEEIKRLRVEDLPELKEQKYEKAKADLRRQMVARYRETLLQVSVLPLNPRANKCSFSEIYIRPRLALEVKEENDETKEEEINSMSEIFTKNGVPLKSLYVIGDAGTGKSSFCKYLVNCWCLAHSDENQAKCIAHETDKKDPHNDNKKDEVDNLEYETRNRNKGDDNENHKADNVMQETDTSDSDDSNGNHEDDNVSSEESEDESSEFESGSNESESDSDESDSSESESDSTESGCNESESDSTESGSIESESDSDESGSNESESDSDESDSGEFEFYSYEYDTDKYQNEFSGVQEMTKFDFLFHIALRRYQNVVSIHEMLKKQYNSKILDEVLENESGNIIILLDGLDEWSSDIKTQNQYQMEGLPEQEYLKNYTVLTTSRPWKIHTLKIDCTENQQLLKLKGFDERSERIMIYRTVSYINSQKGESKDRNVCLRKLDERSLISLKQVPIMLQQLICLWFDSKLDIFSRCSIYTGMLELFFTWNENKGRGKYVLKAKQVDLPQYLTMKRKCKSNRDVIHDMSRLAYETLLKCPENRSLTFDIDLFDELEISDEIRESCVKLGILTEDKCPTLYMCVSEPPSSMFSFIHKSVQEYLAAVNIAINFKIKTNSSGRLKKEDLEEVCTQFVNDIFQNCSTVNEILEQSNVVIMLCGLEPRLATHVSKYMYDIAKEDSLVQRYRRTIDSDISYYSCIKDTQTLIFDSMKESNTFLVESRPSFYLGDLFIDDRGENCDIVCSSIDQQHITPDFVHSIYVDDINIKNYKFSKYLPKYKHLEKIQINESLGSSLTENIDTIDEVNKSIAETIKINASTLRSVSLSDEYKTDNLNLLCKNVLCILPSMNNLVALKIKGIRMTDDVTTGLCEFLEGTSNYVEIHIYIICECIDKKHNVDLSKHKKLQYLNLNSRICVTDIDSFNLEVLKCWNVKSTNYIKIFDSIRKCYKWKELELHLDYFNKSQSFHTSITERLVSVLPFLHNLRELHLDSFRLTDNIIQVPSQMKSLKLFNLDYVIMSMAIWKKFVHSLPSIPHLVDVKLLFCYITEDGEEFNVDMLQYRLGGGGNINEARQYVKDQKQLFIVKDDILLHWFTFATRK